jgi:membrane protease YdiL (CAAX protease family)
MNTRRLVFFVLLACGYSWTLWLLAIGSKQGWLPFHFSPGPLGSFGPAIAALVVAGSREGRWQLLRSLFLYQGLSRWIAFALLVPVGIILVAIAIHAALGGHVPRPDTGKLWLTPVVALGILVLGGPLGEEPGWRGVMVPELAKRFTLLPVSLTVALLWFAWHLPLFWMEGAAQAGSSIALFGATLAALSIVFAWLYLKTAPSLLPVLLLHTSVNVTSFGISYVLPGVDDARTYSLAYLGTAWALAGAVCIASYRKGSKG